jgi:sortase A
VRVRIPSINVNAAVEQVGIDAEGNMDTPKDPWNTAWYAPGVRPGQAGNAAIAGHVDYAGLGQVVFWDLNLLVAGDEVFVDTADGKTLRFVVSDSTYYRPANAPLERIFGGANTSNLNLITCGGAFDPATRQYDQRLVVFTTYAGE